MRIVSGRWGGRILRVPGGQATRPTAERVREAVFSMIQSDIPGGVVLDLFSGSGALALEALSRGARSAVLVDSDRASQRCIRANIASLEAAEARLIPTDAMTAIRRLEDEGERFSLIFLDPPYASGLHTRALEAVRSLLASRALAVAETDIRHPFDIPDGYALRADRRYGDVRVTLLVWEGST